MYFKVPVLLMYLKPHSHSILSVMKINSIVRKTAEKTILSKQFFFLICCISLFSHLL